MINILQVREGGAGSGTPQAAAYFLNVTAGNALYCLNFLFGNTLEVTGITDSQGNTWSRVVRATGASFGLELWKTIAGSSAANTLSITYNSATAGRGWKVIEVSGQGSVLTNGPNNSLDNGSAANPSVLATLTTDTAGIVFCLFRPDSNQAGAPGIKEGNNNSYGQWTNLTGSVVGSGDWAAYKIVESVSINHVPYFLGTGTSTGESLTVAVYGMTSSGGGGEHSAVF